jgi:hypothetical protein
MNMHAPNEEKSDDTILSSEELEQDFNHFPKYHRKLLLGDAIAKWGYFETDNAMRVDIRTVMMIVLEQ